MNLGRRVQLRLAEMGKQRSFLFRQIPKLKPSTLSLMITRDSKRSKWDVELAKALGVRLEWLNSGEFPKLAYTDYASSELCLRLVDLIDQGHLVEAVVSLVENMSNEQRGVVSSKIENLAYLGSASTPM